MNKVNGAQDGLRLFYYFLKASEHQKMTSVLYSAGLNYQSGNPVRQEFNTIRREMDSLRKQVESLTEENLIYRKHIMKLLEGTDGGSAEFTRDLMSVSATHEASSRREAGGGTVQGGGFRR
jgi:hypothetical protein